jgi:hypothetical protein
MRHSIRFVTVALVAAGALVTSTAAAAAPASTSFAVTGSEYAFTSTVGYFAGTGIGNRGDTGLWNTQVVHDPLGSTPTHVNGGSFTMATKSPAGSLDAVNGDFVGGEIDIRNPGLGCTNQQYAVSGNLANVSTLTTSGGSGTFSVLLTHFRASIFGFCITYRATVAGTVSFTYTH